MKKGLLIPALLLMMLSSAAVVMYSFSSKNTAVKKESKATGGFAVVELFTSEGCSSCPPADAAVEKLLAQNSPNVFVLSYHVDYWNRLGWQDPFSQALFSARQKSYGQAFALDGVYTPQVVVNGQLEFVGSDVTKLHAAVENGLQNNKQSGLNFDVKRAGNAVTINYETTATNAFLNAAVVQSDATVTVKRGENGGRTLHHVNIVRALQTADAAEKGQLQFQLPTDFSNLPLQVILFTQDKKNLHITSAAQQKIL